MENARQAAVSLAERRRDLGADELRAWYERVGLSGDAGDELWAAFRSAYFDALWAGADEVSSGPVIAGSRPSTKLWNLSAAGHLTLSFTTSDRFELIETTVEFS